MLEMHKWRPGSLETSEIRPQEHICRSTPDTGFLQRLTTGRNGCQQRRNISEPGSSKMEESGEVLWQLTEPRSSPPQYFSDTTRAKQKEKIQHGSGGAVPERRLGAPRLVDTNPNPNTLIDADLACPFDMIMLTVRPQ